MPYSCEEFRAAFQSMRAIADEHDGRLKLLCHCAPRRCHVRSLASRLDDVGRACRGGGPDRSWKNRTGPCDDEGNPRKPVRDELAEARARARRMYVPPRIAAERRETLGEGRCCFDAFTGAWKLAENMEDESVITHETMRRIAVAQLLKPANAWLETFRDRQVPDGTGELMPQGSYVEYVERMRQPNAWGSVLELTALARCFRINFHYRSCSGLLCPSFFLFFVVCHRLLCDYGCIVYEDKCYNDPNDKGRQCYYDRFLRQSLVKTMHLSRAMVDHFISVTLANS